MVWLHTTERGDITMDAARRARLEAAGFGVGTVTEFLGLTPAEEALVEARVALTIALRERKEKMGITQTSLAKKMKTSQPRVARILAGDPNVSLDQMARAYFEKGATRQDLAAAIAGERDKELAKV